MEWGSMYGQSCSSNSSAWALSTAIVVGFAGVGGAVELVPGVEGIFRVAGDRVCFRFLSTVAFGGRAFSPSLDFPLLSADLERLL